MSWRVQYIAPSFKSLWEISVIANFGPFPDDGSAIHQWRKLNSFGRSDICRLKDKGELINSVLYLKARAWIYPTFSPHPKPVRNSWTATSHNSHYPSHSIRSEMNASIGPTNKIYLTSRSPASLPSRHSFEPYTLTPENPSSLAQFPRSHIYSLGAISRPLYHSTKQLFPAISDCRTAPW
jgi:hypothetical protein